MAEHIAQLSNPDETLLLGEMNHRINSELTCVICAVSVKAMQSGSAAVKTALLEVVELLHQCADVNRALRMPERGAFTDAAKYLQRLCFSISRYRMDHQTMRILVSADDLRLEGGRCWRLGLIVSELLTNVARHAKFDGRLPETRVDLALAGNIVRCRVADNGSASEPVRRGRGLTIIGELASSLGGRVHTSCTAEGSYALLTFPLSEVEQRATGATLIVQLKRRKTRRTAVAGV
jgi:two-component sensor histidine kinase